MENFYDNQVVSAATLNNIAIDLGHPDFSNFVDNTTYNIDKLNDISKSIVSAGVVMGHGNQMKVSMSSNQLTVKNGMCFFNSGAKIKLDEEKILTYQTGVTQYIYVLNDTTLKTALIKVDTENPENITNCDYVLLAVYNADGTITDKRMFSKAKVIIPSANTYYQHTLTLKEQYAQDVKVGEFDVGKVFTYYFILYGSGRGNIATFNTTIPANSTGANCYLKCTQTGTKIEIYQTSTRSMPSTLPVTLIFV